MRLPVEKIVRLLILVLFSLPVAGLVVFSFTFADTDGDLQADTQDSPGDSIAPDVLFYVTSPGLLPTLAMGYAQNLKPELAANIREALLGNDFAPVLC